MAWLRSLTETERPVGSVNSCSNTPGSSKDSEGCEPGAEGCKLDVEWMLPAGKEVGEAQRSNGIASIIFFLETWPPCWTKEITSSDAAEGTCSGSLLRLCDVFAPFVSFQQVHFLTHLKKTQEKQLIIEISLQKHHIVATANSNHQPRPPESQQPCPPAPPPSPLSLPPPEEHPDRQYHHPKDLVG